MSILALIAWIITAMAGLYLLAIWLIEYDPGFRHAAASRLPVPVVCGHVLFAVGGLLSWVMYLITDKRMYSLAAAGAMVVIVAFGLVMVVRWVGVYRAGPSEAFAGAVARAAEPHSGTPRASAPSRAAGAAGSSGVPPRPGDLAVPPERHFPLPGIIAHGIFAITTIVLVMLSVFGSGAS